MKEVSDTSKTQLWRLRDKQDTAYGGKQIEEEGKLGREVNGAFSSLLPFTPLSLSSLSLPEDIDEGCRRERRMVMDERKIRGWRERGTGTEREVREGRKAGEGEGEQRGIMSESERKGGRRKGRRKRENREDSRRDRRPLTNLKGREVIYASVQNYK